MGTAMRIPIIAVALLGVLVACGGASDATGSHAGDGYPALRQRPTVLNSGGDPTPPPAPANMPGGGRGFDAPHSKGKP